MNADEKATMRGTKTGMITSKGKNKKDKTVAEIPTPNSEANEGDLTTAIIQVQNYLSFSRALTPEWKSKDVIDILHCLVQSIGYDAVSLVLVDVDRGDKFLPVTSRGFKIPPGADVVTVWETCVTEDSAINWSKLIKTAEIVNNAVGRWIVHEKIKRLGYIPIHDGENISGFLLACAMTDKWEQSGQIGVNLLELCGGRIGLTLAKGAFAGEVADFVSETVNDIRDQFTLLIGYMDLIRGIKRPSTEQLNFFIQNCEQAITESVHLLDRISIGQGD